MISHDFTQDFTDAASVVVSHNLDTAQALVRVVVDGVSRTDMIESVAVADRDTLTVTLTAAATGSVLVQLPRDWRAGS